MFLVVPVTHYQTSYLKMLVIVIMKQILILKRMNHACLPKEKGIKQNETVKVISKLKF